MSKFLVQDAASGLVVASSAVPGEGGGGGGSNATLTADTNIAAGTGVSINSSGNAAQTWGPAPQVPGTAVTFDGQGSNTIGTLILSPSQFVSFIAGVSAQAGSIDSNNVVSVGAVDTSGPSANAQLWNGNSGSVQAAVLSASKFVLAFSDPNTGNLNVVVGSIAANVITYGTPVEAVAASITLNPCCLNIFALDASHFALTYQNELVIGSVSGTTITLGSPGEITANVNGNPVALATMDATHILVAYQDGNDSNFLKLVVATVSGTDVSFGTPLTISVAQSSGNNAVMLLSPTQAAVTSYLIGGYEVYLVGISGTTLTLGHNASWDQSDGPFGVFAPMDATHFLIWSISNEEGVSSASVGTVTPSALTFEQLLLSPSDLYSFTGSSPHYLTVAGTVASGFADGGFILSDANFAIYGGNDTQLSDPLKHQGLTAYWLYGLDSSRALATLVDFNNVPYARVIKFNPINNGPIGFTAAAASEGAKVTIQQNGVASGLSGLSPGSSYYYNGDGTLITANTGKKAGTALTTSTLLVAA